MSTLLIIAALSYLLGTIPFGYLLVRIFRGEDVRQSGSGNIGATNVSRTSPVLGVLTLLLDALKGTAAVALSYVVADRVVAIPYLEQLALGALFAVLGHMFPVWLKFRGGKGVATGLGFIYRDRSEGGAGGPRVSFWVAVFIFRYVSLGVHPRSRMFSATAWLTGRCAPLRDTALALISTTATSRSSSPVTHRDNIRRLA